MLSTTKTNTTRLGMEHLEDRSMPAAVNYFVLDFTPDTHAGSFADTFRHVKTASGYAPNFLDFNGDRYVNNTDIQIAAQQVTNKVMSFYAPALNQPSNHLFFKAGDVFTNTNMGINWLNYGRANPSVQVSVMYFGGTGGAGVLGRAPLAGDGQNIEGFGDTYTRTAALSLLAKSNATPADFVNKVANAAAHELGHMMGLRHSYSGVNNIMNAYQSYSPGSAYFVNAWQNTEGGPTQHGYLELAKSFQWNQQQVQTSYYLGGRFQHDYTEEGCNNEHEHEHEHKHEHEDESLAGVAEGIRLAPEADNASKRQHHVIETKLQRLERFEHSKPHAKVSQLAALTAIETHAEQQDEFDFGFSIAVK